MSVRFPQMNVRLRQLSVRLPQPERLFLLKMAHKRHFHPLPAELFLALALPRLLLAEPDHNDPAAELASFRLPPGFEANLFFPPTPAR